MNLKDLYFSWMCEKIFPNIRDRNNYINLLRCLHEIVFHYSIPMDENRKQDGVDLRYRFAQDRGYSNRDIEIHIDQVNECSMLEMMVALALRGDDNMLYDYETGSKADYIFMVMLRSLEIDNMVNGRFNMDTVHYSIDRLLNHEYAYDGRGGLFTVKHPRRDMREVDIWYQMCWSIQELYK